jgi:predicted MFS family arabinose efflux permease
MGRLLVVVGLAIAGIGLLMLVGIPFGRLPGDLVYRRGSFTAYVPIGTSIVLSVLLTLLFVLLRR